jgi:hypothetical protein
MKMRFWTCIFDPAALTWRSRVAHPDTNHRDGYVLAVFVRMYAATPAWHDERVFRLKHYSGSDPLYRLRSALPRSWLHAERRMHLDKKRRDLCAAREVEHWFSRLMKKGVAAA